MSFINYHYWPPQITQGMKKELINSNIYDTFTNVPNNLYLSLKVTADLYPQKKALVEDNRSLNYKQFIELVDAMAYNLYNTYKVRKGDRIALLMVNSIDFCISFFSILKLGAVAIPLSTKHKDTEILQPLKDSGARIIIADDIWMENIENIIELTSIEHCIISNNHKKGFEGTALQALYSKSGTDNISYDDIKPYDPAVIMYTSGTTGTPKGAVLAHYNILHGVICYKRILNLGENDSTIIAVPIFHITGLAALLCLFVYIGGTIYLQPYFIPEKVLKTVKENNITFIHGSPTVFILLLKEANNLGEIKSLRKCACGSANMPFGVLVKIKKWLPNMDFHTVYGLTETSSPATIFPGDIYKSDKIGSSGLPIPGIELKIVDDKDNTLVHGEIGELLVRGPVVLEGYWNNPEGTAASIKEGWFRTGDMAQIDNDGYVYIVDRKKDMINRGGEKIYSLEVENILYNHPGINEAAVIGVHDPVYGEVVKAVIVKSKGYLLNEEEVIDWVKKKLAKYKAPKYVQFIDEMPKTDNGKISKKKIRDLYG